MSYPNYPPEGTQYRPSSYAQGSSSPNNPFRDRVSFADAQQRYDPPAGLPPAYDQLTGRPMPAQFTPDVKAPQSQYPMVMGYTGGVQDYSGGPAMNAYSYAASAPGSSSYSQASPTGSYKEPASDLNRNLSARSTLSRSPQHPPQQYLAPNYPPYGQGLSPHGSRDQSSYNDYPSQDSHHYPPRPGSSSGTGQAQPSPSPSFIDRMKGPSSGSLLDPPPPPFSRAPSNNSPYSPFTPCALISVDNTLDKGFPLMPPPSPSQPHPFVLHDVGEEDWTRFVHDIKAASALTPMNKIGASVIPMALGVGFVGGILLSKGIEKRMKTKKYAQVADIVDNWNHYFFHPRRIEVTLAQGRVVYAGTDGAPPDMPHLGTDSYVSKKDADSSSSSSDDDKKSDRRQKRRERHERRTEKRERRRERRELKETRKHARNEKWRLIVSYKPLNL